MRRQNQEYSSSTIQLFLMGFGGIAIAVAVAASAAAMQYQYDSLNRLTRVVYDDGKVVTYSYDAVGNRTKRKAFVPVAADFDIDGDVDLDDFAVLETGMNGPGQPPGQSQADLDQDGDCDLEDFVVFAASFTGAL